MKGIFLAGGSGTPEKRGGGTRNGQIEGLRGTAILIIVAFHIFDRFQQIYLAENIEWMDFWGEFGVAIFLLISCFYMVDFQENNSKTVPIAKRVGKKLLRLWPSYVVAITLIFALVHLSCLPKRMCSTSDYLLNLFFLNGFIGTAYVDGAHWYLTTLISLTLIIEIAKEFNVVKKPIFYIAWISLLEFAYLISKKEAIRFLGTDRVGYAFFIIAVKWLIQHREVKLKCKCVWVMVAGAGVTIIVQFVGIRAAVELILLFPIFLGCIFEKLAFMSNPIFLWVGTISYPLYLIHQNVAFIIEYQLLQISGVYCYLYGWLAFLLVFMVAVLLYWAVEIFLRRQLRKLLGEHI